LTFYYSFDVLFIVMGTIQLMAAVVTAQLLRNDTTTSPQ
jgi:hypothetical protein